MNIFNVLKQKKTNDPFSQDPFELFAFEDLQKDKSAMPLLFKIALSMVLLGFSGLGAFWVYSKWSTNPDAKTIVYFEIKTLDSSGHPIAGVQVYHDQKKVGLTDSFGEWRRFLRMSPNQMASLKFRKKTDKGELFGVKSFPIPANRNSTHNEWEIQGSIQLNLRSQKLNSQNRGATKSLSENPKSQNRSNSKAKDEIPDDQTPRSVRVVVFEQKTKHWNQNDLTRNNMLQQKIGPEFEDLLNQKSILSDANEKLIIKLKHLAVPSTFGFIFVEGVFQGKGKNKTFAFLANYQADESKTIHLLVDLLKRHLDKTYRLYKEKEQFYIGETDLLSEIWKPKNDDWMIDSKGRLFKILLEYDSYGNERWKVVAKSNLPCSDVMIRAKECRLFATNIYNSAPEQDWKKLKMKIDGPINASSKVFMSGFQAERVSKNTFGFWGPATRPSNLTILEPDGKLMRARVQTHKARLAIVKLPSWM